MKKNVYNNQAWIQRGHGSDAPSLKSHNSFKKLNYYIIMPNNNTNDIYYTVLEIDFNFLYTIHFRIYLYILFSG